MKKKPDRRRFLYTALGGAAGLPLVSRLRAVGARVASGEIPTRLLGKTGEKVSIVALGGAHLGYEHVSEAECERIIHSALDQGVNFLDNSWDYNDGRSEERMGRALRGGRREKAFLMTKFCSHREGWDKKTALRMLDESLQRLRTDHLDLWQLHSVTSPEEPFLAFAPESAAEAMLEAKEAGKVRYLGFTGHRNPRLHNMMLEKDFPFDAVQMPLNVFDPHFLSFEKDVLPELVRREIGVIGMKPLGGGNHRGAILETGVVRFRECFHYVMNLPVSTICIGITSYAQFEEALEAARSFRPFSREEVAELLERTLPFAREGEHETYKRALPNPA